MGEMELSKWHLIVLTPSCLVSSYFTVDQGRLRETEGDWGTLWEEASKPDKTAFFRGQRPH